jgi:hypothetical protein
MAESEKKLFLKTGDGDPLIRIITPKWDGTELSGSPTTRSTNLGGVIERDSQVTHSAHRTASEARENGGVHLTIKDPANLRLVRWKLNGKNL